MNKQKQAFTLVELIVVITILAILGTIAFISMSGYSKSSRDSVRISDVSNMKTSLELFHLNAGKYPLPDDNEIVEYETQTLWYQGKFGSTVVSNLSRNLSEVPTDPLTDKQYIFSVANNKNEFEILSLLEGDLALNTITQTNAANLTVTPRIDGTYNGVFIKTAGYIVPTPSIVTAETITPGSGLTLNGTNIKSQVTNLGDNIPNVGNVVSNTGGLDIALSVFTGTVVSDDTAEKKALVMQAIQGAYTGSSLANDDIYKYILSVSGESELATLLDTVVFKGSNTVAQQEIVPQVETDIILDKINNLGGTGLDMFNSVVYDGTNYIAAGYSASDLSLLTGGTNTVGANDFVIAKFDTDLNFIKINNLGGTGHDMFNSVIYDGTNYIAAGNSSSDLSLLTGGTNTLGTNDFVIAKFDTDLNLVQINNLGGTGSDSFFSLIYDGINYIAVGDSASDLSLLTGGSTAVGANDFVIAKFDPSLNLIKINNLGGTGSEGFKSIIYDGTNYIAAGNSSSNLSGLTGGTFSVGGSDFIIAKFDTSLNLITLNNLGGTLTDVFQSVIYDGSNYIAAGYSQSNLSGLTGGSTAVGSSDFVIAKFDTNLNLIKINNFGGTLFELIASVIYDGTNYITAGYSSSNLSTLTGGTDTTGGYESVMVEFDTDLNLIEINNIGGTLAENLNSVIYNGTNYIAVGIAESDLSTLTGGTTNAGSYDFAISKY